MDELIINEDNFDKYFFDVRKHNPQKGQIMACYTAIAEFTNGTEKRQILDLLAKTDKAISVVQVMRKLMCASEEDSVRVPQEMAIDLVGGMTVEQVLNKSYKYTFQMYFYTQKEYVPNDPHWSIISLLNMDSFVDSMGNRFEIKMKEMTVEESCCQNHPSLESFENEKKA